MRQLLIALPLVLSACGAIYTVPKVDKADSMVTVIEMGLNELSAVNAIPYKPKPIPAAFDQSISATISAPRIPSGDIVLPSRIPARSPNDLYRIGVGDALILTTPSTSYQDPLLGATGLQDQRQGYSVQDDGTISVPELGRIDVGGLSLKEAESTIFTAMVDRQIDPKFALDISEFKSQSITIGGAIRSPGVLPLTMRPLTLIQAIQSSGGVSLADTKFISISLERDGQNYQIPYQEMLKKSSWQNIRLKDGDSLLVAQNTNIQAAIADANLKNSIAAAKAAEARTIAQQQRSNFKDQLDLGIIKQDHVFLFGEVTQQGRFPLPFGGRASLADALYSSSGVEKQNGDIAEIYLLRFTKNGPTPITAYHVDGSNAINLLLTTKMELRPDDMVFVAMQKVTAWNRVLSQILPSANVADRLTGN